MSNFKKAILVLGTVMGLAGCLGLAACGDATNDGHEHTYSSEWVQVTAPTCTEPGEKESACTVKGCTATKKEAVSALGHKYKTEEKKKAECGVDGVLHVTCERGDYENDEVIPALEHDYRPDPEGYTPADCTHQSVTKQICIFCDDIKEIYGDPLGHTISNATIIKAPTCTETGLRAGKCSVCGTTFTEEKPDTMPAKGHTLSPINQAIIKAATCTETGTLAGTCSVCDEEATEVIPLAAHVWESDYKIDIVPTYTVKGRKSIHCKNCSIKKDQVDMPVLESETKLEHEFRLVNKAGSPMDVNCTAAIVDVEGNSTQATFKNGKCKISLLPDNYTVNLIELPTGYFTEPYTVGVGESICEFVVGLSVIEGSAPAGTVYKVGSVMYDFEVTDIENNTYKLSELAREYRLIMLNFWATWCGPCKMEFPAMDQAYRDYKDKVFIIAISTSSGDSVAKIKDFRDSMGLTFPMAAVQNSGGITNRFYYQGIPTTILISPDGIVLFQESGALQTKAQFTRLFDTYMASAPASANLAVQGERILTDAEYLTGKELEL